MLRLLRQTLLYRRVAEARTEYRSVRLAEHRAALRAKRAAVEARVKLEVQRAQLERAVLQLEAARTALRVQNAKGVADAHSQRRTRLRDALAAHGEPEPPASSAAITEGGEGSAGEAEAEAFKREMVSRVEALLPEGEAPGSGVGRRVASEVLRDCVGEVGMEGEGDRAAMSLRVVAGVARRAGVGWEEMEKLVALVESDEGRREELREAVRAAMAEEAAGGEARRGSA